MAFFLALICPYFANADDWYDELSDYFTVYLTDGSILFKIGRRVYVDDEYVSQDNKKYIIYQVDAFKKTALAEFMTNENSEIVQGIIYPHAYPPKPP